MKKAAVNIALIVSLLLPAASALADKHGQKRGTPAQAQAMVAKAVALFDKEGAEAAFDRLTNRPGAEFRNADLYIFVLKADKGGPLVAHGATPSLVGREVVTLIDPDGLNIGRAILDKATAKGAWVDYGWKDPISGKVVPKSSWVVRHKGLIFGCGIYKP